MEDKNKYFSIASFRGMKGYLALGILVHHLSQFLEIFSGTYIGWALLLLGRWCVAGFLVLSGFGLVSAYKQKGEEYIRNFGKKKLLPFYITYCVYLILYIIFELLMGSEITVTKIIQSFTFGSTLLNFGWYLQMTYLLYIAFWVSFLVSTNDYVKLSVLTVISVVLIAVLCAIDYPYASRVAIFWLGAFMGIFKEQFEKMLKGPGKYIAASICIVMFFGYTYLSTRTVLPWGGEMPSNLAEVLATAADIFFAALVIVFTAIFSGKASVVLDNQISRWLGKHSFEIYVLQGFVLRGMRKIVGYWVLYAIVSVIVIMLLAVVARKLSEILGRQRKKLLKF